MMALYTAAQCRELDRLAIEAHGMNGFDLMQRAGRAAFRVLLEQWPEAARITVCCGKGNNAGDGYIVAGLARQAGLDVTLHQLGDAGDLQGDAARAAAWAREAGVVEADGPPSNINADVVVDALLGTGLQGPLRPPFAAAARAINASGCPVLAVDVPSGVDADTGAVAQDAVRAAVTVTFIGRKLGLHTGPGVSACGRVVWDDLGVPGAVYRALPGCPWLHYAGLPMSQRLPPRDANAYKHALGHLLVVGGDYNMGGAPLLAAESALRCGAGMVTVLTRAAHRPAFLARRPEIMVADPDDADARQTLLAKARGLVIGPGLGVAAWGRELLQSCLAAGLPTVLDADGLTGFAELGLTASGPLIVTPHVAEAARLLDADVVRVQNDRPRAVRELAVRVRGVAVLKGAGTLIAAEDPAESGDPTLLGVCAHGNPGMASAGMGDVLSGVIGALLVQGMAPAAAAVSGTCLHSLAADHAAAALGQHSLLAADLLDFIPRILRDGDRSGR